MLRQTVLILSVMAALVFASPARASKCFTIIQGAEGIDVPPFIQEIVHLYAGLEDIPKFIDPADFPAKVNPAAKAQLAKIKQAFRGGLGNDSVSKAFRADLSTDVLEYKWQPSDGFEIKKQNETIREMLLFGRIVGQKDGVYLVVLPPDEVLWDEAKFIPLRFFFVSQFVNGEPATAKFDQRVGPLAREMHIRLFGPNAYQSRNPVVAMPYSDGVGFYLVEEAVSLYRDDALKHPSLAKLLSLFQ